MYGVCRMCVMGGGGGTCTDAHTCMFVQTRLSQQRQKRHVSEVLKVAKFGAKCSHRCVQICFLERNVLAVRESNGATQKQNSHTRK